MGIFFYGTTHKSRLSVGPEFPKNHRFEYRVYKLSITIAISKVRLTVAFTVRCEHGILTCITTVKHLDTLGVPIFHKTMVTVKLHLVSLSFVVPLIHISSMVNILGLLIPNIFHEDRGWVRSLFHFVNILNEVFIKLHVPFVPKVLLIIDNYAKSLGVSSLSNE